MGERIRKGRLEQRLFQKKLAKIIRVNEMTLVNWKEGKTKPFKPRLEGLEKILGDLPHS